jgi:hypothetical protein
MSKGKYKRKRERSRQKAEQQEPNIGFLNSKVIPSEKHKKTPNPSNHNRCEEKEELVSFRESIKRSSFTDWCIAAFTLALTVVAVYQGVVMGGQLDVMRKDQRPWIKTTFEPFGVQPGSTISGNLHTINNGKTPAKQFEGKFTIEKVKNGENPRLDYGESWDAFTGGALFPNDPQTRAMSMQDTAQDRVSGTKSSKPVILSKDDYNDFMDGKIFFVAYASVSYYDFFGIRHWTKYCNFIYPTGVAKDYTARNCTDYNDIDDN